MLIAMLSTISVSSGAKRQSGQDRAQEHISRDHLRRCEHRAGRHLRIELGQLEHGAMRQGVGEGGLNRDHDVEFRDDDELDLRAPALRANSNGFRARARRWR